MELGWSLLVRRCYSWAGAIAGGMVGALLAIPLLSFTRSFIQSLNGEREPEPAAAKAKKLRSSPASKK